MERAAGVTMMGERLGGTCLLPEASERGFSRATWRASSAAPDVMAQSVVVSEFQLDSYRPIWAHWLLEPKC